MRKFILFLFLIAPVCSLAQQNFLIKGKIKNIQAPAKVYLVYRYEVKGAKSHWDSTVVKNGEFEFKGTVIDTVVAQLMVDYKGVNLDDIWGKDNVDTKLIYLANGTTIISGNDSIRNSRFSGNKLNEDYYRYIVLTNTAKSDSEKKVLDKKFIRENPNSYISLDLALKDLSGVNTITAEDETLFRSLSATVRFSKAGVEYEKKSITLKSVTNGSIAPEFTLPDTNNNPVKLSSFRGKYVLIDFWASWCGPCRHANPSIVKEFNKYKSKNFTILGVSLDNTGGKDVWLKAIHKDGLTWAQGSDLKGWNSGVAKLYAVHGIPQNFLIDPDGKIIAQNLDEDGLESKLVELFGKM
ncbi:redoxin domain-containing protein [Mucilaginibacter sp. X5P1]|uniref:redoxin domain-containing protein n=1 Tax=Mucilaginibacter sp. X5P1 TaxID=2723088 RepID=UPI0016201242|nr:redoxin domain-containing protein [Mucilaginibacter sp. X5P1]MBB6138901.1 peroxiredoxin [Mucilaginibacter sp. X5P1]